MAEHVLLRMIQARQQGLDGTVGIHAGNHGQQRGKEAHLGVALTVAGFMTPPVGEISDSVLWFAAQTMIYAGSVFGVSIYVNDRISGLKDRINKLENNEKNK